MLADELPPHCMDIVTEGVMEIAKFTGMEDHLMTEEAKILAETLFTALKNLDADMMVRDHPKPNQSIVGEDVGYTSLQGFTWNTLPARAKESFILACEESRSVLGM